MGKKVVTAKKVKGKQGSPEKATAEAQTNRIAPAACTRPTCCRPATRHYECQMCPVGSRPQYPACDKCDLEDLVKSEAKKKSQKKLKDQDRNFRCGTCIFTHIQKEMPFVLSRSTVLSEMSPAPAGAARLPPHARDEDHGRDKAPEPPAPPASEGAGLEEESDGGASTRAASSAIDREGSTGGDTSDSEEDAEVGAAGEPAGLSRDLDGKPKVRWTAACLEEEWRALEAEEEADADFEYLAAACLEEEWRAREEAEADVEYLQSRVREVGGEDAGAEALRPRWSAPLQPGLQPKNEISAEWMSGRGAGPQCATSEERADEEPEPFADGFMETLGSVMQLTDYLAREALEEIHTAQREVEDWQEWPAEDFAWGECRYVTISSVVPQFYVPAADVTISSVVPQFYVPAATFHQDWGFY